MKSFGAMDLDELLALKAKLEAEIVGRLEKERKRLTESLQRLDSIADQAGQSTSSGVDRRKGRKLAPKYRNPSNPRQTWAGRGLRPKWLVAALRGGKHKLADFEIHQKD